MVFAMRFVLAPPNALDPTLSAPCWLLTSGWMLALDRVGVCSSTYALKRMPWKMLELPLSSKLMDLFVLFPRNLKMLKTQQRKTLYYKEAKGLTYSS